MVEGAQTPAAAAVEQAKQLRPPAASPRRLDAGKLSLHLTGEEQRRGQEAWAAGRRIRRCRGRSMRSSCWRRMIAAASFAES